MAKRYNIRWQEADEQNLKRSVKNFNAKITRLEKQFPEIKNALPEKITVKQMKELIVTRQDLKRELNALKRFTDRNNRIAKNNDGSFQGISNIPVSKENVQATVWQIKEMKRRVAVINRKRKKRYDDMYSQEAISRGEKLGYTVGDIGMGTADEVALRPMQAFTPSMTRKDLDKKFNALMKESQDAFWREKEIRLMNNVINGIKANYGGMFPEDADQIIDAIQEMDFSTFYKIFKSEQGEMEIVSPPPGASFDDIMEQNIEALKTTWVPKYKADAS